MRKVIMGALRRFFLNEKAVLALVILNTVSIFVGGYYQDSFLFTVIDSVFTLLFLAEAVCKIREMSWTGYWIASRNIYPDCTLADLYDDVMMPIELRKAHQANDRAVLEAYGFPSNAS